MHPRAPTTRFAPLARRSQLSAVFLVLALATACGGDDEGPAEPGDASTTLPAVTTTEASPSTSTSPSPSPSATGRRSRATSEVTPNYGDACALGSLPDCIDPDGDGQATYLQGGADCMQRQPPGTCSDLDGDGKAGYPDSG